MSTRTLVGEQAKRQGGVQYDTGEVRTERVDPINGKRIYTKAINFGTLTNTGTKNVNHNIANLNLAVGAYMKVEAMVTTGTVFTPVELTPNVSAFSINATQISITTLADLSASTMIVILEYTKT